jgi:hypothetical protein
MVLPNPASPPITVPETSASRTITKDPSSACFACRLVGGELATSNESLEVGFFTPTEIEAMPVHESIRLRIRHYLEHRPQPVIA